MYVMHTGMYMTEFNWTLKFMFKLLRDTYADVYEMNLSVINEKCVQLKYGQVQKNLGSNCYLTCLAQLNSRY